MKRRRQSTQEEVCWKKSLSGKTEDRKHFGEYFCMCKDSEGIVALGLE